MNPDSKQFSFKVATIAVAILFSVGMYSAAVAYNEHTKKVAHQEAQDTIRKMVAFCGFAKVKPEEQTAIRSCGDDVEAVRAQLKSICGDRVLFWKGILSDAEERFKKLKSLKEGQYFWSQSLENTYQEGMQKILKDGKQALDQIAYWEKKGKELDAWKPGMETLENKTETKQGETKI